MHPPDDRIRPAQLVSAIVSRLPAILAETHHLLVEQHPDYAEFLAENRSKVVNAAEGFLARLVDVIELDPSITAPLLASEQEQFLFEELGRLHYHHRQDITCLLAAYRVGAVVAWRHLVAAALHRDVAAKAVGGLATTLFTTIDQLSSASLRGYAQAHTTTGHDRTLRREELAELLVSDRADTATVHAAATRAAWPLPNQAAIILIQPDNAVARRLLNRLGPTCLRLQRAQTLVAIVPDPDGPGRRAQLANTLRGAAAVIGTTVALGQLPSSLRLAEHALRLQHACLLTDEPLFVDEHLPAMVAHRDQQLLAAVRHRLCQTLRSWLMHMGNHAAIASELHVHPQTVRTD
jgi:GGDEF-like domain/PucR C-terminal helix-turn-helix domain